VNTTARSDDLAVNYNLGRYEIDAKCSAKSATSRCHIVWLEVGHTEGFAAIGIDRSIGSCCASTGSLQEAICRHVVYGHEQYVTVRQCTSFSLASPSYDEKQILKPASN
jgi:hypothetical protein